MFGYIKPYVPLLTVAEYEAYKGVYCGLCREMGRSTGQVSRMTLSYDFAFLAFFRMTVEKVPTEFDRGVCIAHPFKKKAFAKNNTVLTYCSYATAILAAEKTKDNIADEKGGKRLMAKAVYPFEKHIVSKIPEDFSTLAEKVSAYLERLSEIEKNKTPSIDRPAEVFGELLGEVCSFGYEAANERIAKEFGRSIGKIIYVLDAAEDIFDDLNGEKYNPIALIYADPLTKKDKGDQKENAGSNETANCKKCSKKKDLILRPEIKDTLMTAVMLELKRAKTAFSLLDSENANLYSRIISNILDYGIPEESDRVFSGRGKREDPLKHDG